MTEAIRRMSLGELTRITAQAVREQTGRPLEHPVYPYDNRVYPTTFLSNTCLKAKRKVEEREGKWQVLPHPGTKSILYTSEQLVQILEEVRQLTHGEGKSSWNIRKTLGDPDVVIDAVRSQLLPENKPNV